MQNEEPQRPATARPSLLSAGSGAGETASILSELDGVAGKGAPPGPAGRGRKGVVVATVLALAALGSTAALVMRDVNSVAQVTMATQGEAMPEAAADGGGHRVAVGEPQVADSPAVAADAAAAPAITSVPASATDSAIAPDGNAAPAAAAGVAVPAVALAAALAAPSPDKTPAAATIVDTAPAHAEPAVVRPAVVKERKAAPAKERHARAAKAKGRAAADKGGKTLKAQKAQKKPVQTRQVQQAKPPRQPSHAKPDNDVELLAALVAHTRPRQGSSAAPCQPGDDKSSVTACGAGQKR